MKCSTLACFAAVSASATLVYADGVKKGQIKNLVTFGDSYTDIVSVGDGGTAWPVYAAGYANLSLFPFAKSGATCSNNLTNRPFPPVMESQLPTFYTELSNGTLKTVADHQDETVYTLWIGTNDLGEGSIITGEQMPGVTVVNTTRCAVDWVKDVYAKGGRNFIFQNMIPLQDVILYSNVTYPNKFWTDAHNATDWSIMMTEMTTSGNEIAKLMLQNLALNLHDAHIALFDSHTLFSDMRVNPADFLNGTAPLNVITPLFSCVYPLNADMSTVTPNCTEVEGTGRDSYLWFDELHPSEQADRVVARHIANAILGEKDEYTTWFS